MKADIVAIDEDSLNAIRRQACSAQAELIGSDCPAGGVRMAMIESRDLLAGAKTAAAATANRDGPK